MHNNKKNKTCPNRQYMRKLENIDHIELGTVQNLMLISIQNVQNWDFLDKNSAIAKYLFHLATNTRNTQLSGRTDHYVNATFYTHICSSPATLICFESHPV